MRKGIACLFTIVALTAGNKLLAQTEYITGQGRVAVGDQILNDTTSIDKGRNTSGYTLFDMGVNVSRDELIKGHAMLRIRNEFGGFFGDGVSFEFRQLRIEGLIGKVVKYELGDLDVKLTPYTIHNFDEMYHEFESELFAIKRRIVYYENFYTDNNTWRMQGGNMHTTFLFTKGIEKVKVRGFGNRIISAQGASNPDRFLYGTEIDVIQGKFGEIGFNMANIDDIPGTVTNADVAIKNRVATVDFKLKYDINDNFRAELFGEVGQSSYNFSRLNDTISVDYNDGFYDVGLAFAHKPSNTRLAVSYREVGANFTSPAAQTRRINDYGTPGMFGTLSDGATVRNMSLFDRFSQEQGLYTQSISPVMGAFNGSQYGLGYNPLYNSATPYGDATPNRKGLTAHLVSEDSAKLYRVNVKAQLLSEITNENNSDLANFSNIEAGAVFNINQVIGWKKLVALQGGVRLENAERKGNLEYKINSTLIDAGIDVEIFARMHLLAGYKSLSGKGDFYYLNRDEFNRVPEGQTPNLETFDMQDNITAFGWKYIFSERASFSMQGIFVNTKDKSETRFASYDMRQLYMVYIVNF